jgi:hypothetical protein
MGAWRYIRVGIPLVLVLDRVDADELDDLGFRGQSRHLSPPRNAWEGRDARLAYRSPAGNKR